MYFHGVRRRDFIGLIAGAAAAWPQSVGPQEPSMPVIGYLSGSTIDMMRDYVAAFLGSLADSGFVESRNVRIEYRWAEGHNDRLPAIAEELVRRQVAIIVVGGSTPGSLAAKAATQTIPVV